LVVLAVIQHTTMVVVHERDEGIEMEVGVLLEELRMLQGDGHPAIKYSSLLDFRLRSGRSLDAFRLPLF